MRRSIAAILARKELVELYQRRMGESLHAAPVLAQMAEELRGTTEGSWAAQELARVKRSMAPGGPQQA